MRNPVKAARQEYYSPKRYGPHPATCPVRRGPMIVFPLLLVICAGTASAQQFSLTVVWTVTPIGGLVNPWSGSETLTITGQNYVFTGQLTNPNSGCEVQVTESGQGQYIAPVGQNPPVSFSFPPQVAIVANETFCPSQSRGDISNYPGSTFPVTILATPIAGGYSLSTTTAYPPNTYEGNSQVTVTATGFLSASGFTCPAGSNVDVTLPSISVTPSLSIKPWQITYARWLSPLL